MKTIYIIILNYNNFKDTADLLNSLPKLKYAGYKLSTLVIDNGSIDNSFNPGTGADGTIYTTSIQNDGKIIIGKPIKIHLQGHFIHFFLTDWAFFLDKPENFRDRRKLCNPICKRLTRAH